MHFHAVGVLYMAAIDDLIDKIEDNELRLRIAKEVKELQKRKKFGLVFEEHLPECTPLYDVPVKIGKNVALKNGSINDTYTVLSIDDGIALCLKKGQDKPIEFAVKDLVVVATFGEPIYPYLQPIDSVCNAPDSNLWHTLIEADNYHALQLLDYLYHGKVDCIYIDPPYNTGAKDWKYNNNYVDGNDAYRHSKWLSFMKKRLELAKKLLNPKDSVLIVTIDEKEFLHLGCLLEELFSEANIQMISTIIAQKGVARTNSFYRTNEYIFFVQLGDSKVNPLYLSEQWQLGKKASGSSKGIVWAQLRRGATNYLRSDRPKLFYPIIFNSTGTRILDVGEYLPEGQHPSSSLERKGDTLWLWPIKANGEECNWQLSQSELKSRIKKGYVKIGRLQENTIWISYLKSGSIKKIENNEVDIIGYEKESGTIITDASKYEHSFIPGSQWNIELHDATYHGSQLLNKIFYKKVFSFPKSLYSVKDTLHFMVATKPNALIIDFFGGSGTTMHAVNLLNAEDNGHRRCIMVTNNEVSDSEAKSLYEKNYCPGDIEWEKLGIAKHVTWPRTKCSIMGIDINGEALKGDYFLMSKNNIEYPRTIKQIAINANLLSFDARKSIVGLIGKESIPQSLLKNNNGFIISEKHTTSIIFDLAFIDEYINALQENDHITDIFIVTDNNAVFRKLKQEISDAMGRIIKEEPVKLPMADGFKSNCAYFKLGFLDKTAVKIGRQFREILPLLWMKSGSVGVCPQLEGDSIPNMLVFPENHFAVLVKDSCFADFKEQVEQHPEIDYVYIVTDYEDGYRAKISNLNVKNTFQLYSDYLDNFDINYRRNKQ